MSDAGFSWTILSDSRERRVWLCCAGALSFVALVALAVALGLEPQPLRALALATSAGLVIAAGLTARRPGRRLALRIATDGSVWLRPEDPQAEALGQGEPAPAVRLWPTWVGSRCAAFRHGRGAIVLWHDSLPPGRFRLLCAHARWHVERSQPSTAVPAP